MKVTIRVPARLLQKGRLVDNPNFVRDKPVASFFKFYLSMNSVLNICCPLMCMFVTGAHRIGSCCKLKYLVVHGWYSLYLFYNDKGTVDEI